MSFASQSKGKEVVMITSLLSIFNVVEIKQMREMFSHLPDPEYGKILYRLKRDGLIYVDRRTHYFSISRYAMDKSKTESSIMAFWALIRVKKLVDHFCAGSEPILMCFSSKDGMEYDMILLTEENKRLLADDSYSVPDEVRRLFIVPSMDETEDFSFRDENDYVMEVQDDGTTKLYRMQGGDDE